MSPNIIRSAKVESPLARRKRRAFIAQSLIVSAIIAIVMVGSAYWILFSSAFAIDTTIVEGAEGRINENVNDLVGTMLERRLFGFIKTGRNMILFDGDELEKQILSKISEIQDAKVEKDYPHALRVVIIPRVSLGVWCRRDKCAHFDETGFAYGSAIPSSGTLFLVVRDQREGSESGELLDSVYFVPITSAYALMRQRGITVRDVVIPAEGINEIMINTADGYSIKMAIDTDISTQVRALLAFMSQKRQEDPAFAPVYVDLRIPDRIYYR